MERQIKSERNRRQIIKLDRLFNRSEVLRADGDRIRDVIISRGNVAKVCYYMNDELLLQQVLNAEGQSTSFKERSRGEAASKLLAAEAEKKSLEMIASALEGTGILATEYMVAQQYLTILCNLMSRKDNSKVVLLPAKTIGEIQHIVSANC